MRRKVLCGQNMFMGIIISWSSMYRSACFRQVLFRHTQPTVS